MDLVFWVGKAALPSGNLLKQPCQLLESPVHPYSFTQNNPKRAVFKTKGDLRLGSKGCLLKPKKKS